MRFRSYIVLSVLAVFFVAFLFNSYVIGGENQEIYHDLYENPEPGLNVVTVEDAEGELLEGAEIYINGDKEAETNSSGRAEIYVPGSHYFVLKIVHGEKVYEEKLTGITGELMIDGPQTWVTEGEEVEYVIREDILHNHSFEKAKADIYVDGEYIGEKDSFSLTAPEQERMLVEAVKGDLRTSIDVEIYPPVEMDVLSPEKGQEFERGELARAEFLVEGLNNSFKRYNVVSGSNSVSGEVASGTERIVDYIPVESEEILFKVEDRLRERNASVNVDLVDREHELNIDESDIEVLWPNNNSEFPDYRAEIGFRVLNASYDSYVIMVDDEVRASGEIVEKDQKVVQELLFKEGGVKDWRIGLIGDEKVFSRSRTFNIPPIERFFSLEKSGPDSRVSYDEVNLTLDVDTSEMVEVEVFVENHHGEEIQRFMQRPRDNVTYTFSPDLFFREHVYEWYAVMSLEDQEIMRTDPTEFQITERRPHDPGSCPEGESELGLC